MQCPIRFCLNPTAGSSLLFSHLFFRFVFLRVLFSGVFGRELCHRIGEIPRAQLSCSGAVFFCMWGLGPLFPLHSLPSLLLFSSLSGPTRVSLLLFLSPWCQDFAVEAGLAQHLPHVLCRFFPLPSLCPGRPPSAFLFFSHSLSLSLSLFCMHLSLLLSIQNETGTRYPRLKRG